MAEWRRGRYMTNRCFLGNIDFTLHKCEERDGVDVAPLGNRAAITRCKWDENRNILKGGVVATHNRPSVVPCPLLPLPLYQPGRKPINLALRAGRLFERCDFPEKTN